MRQRPGWERFALIRIHLSQGGLVAEDFFCPATSFVPDTTHLRYRDTNELFFENGELVLVGNNGTQINFDKKVGRKWAHFCGLSLLWASMSHADEWAEFVDRCVHADVHGHEVWGIGKWAGQKSLCSRRHVIIHRIRREAGRG